MEETTLTVKEITVWEASDGRRFDDKSKCSGYEGFLQEANQILSRLGDAPAPGSFVRHLHSRLVEVTYAVKEGLLAETGDAAYGTAIDLHVEWHGWLNPAYGYLGRILADYDGPFRKVVGRLACIGDDHVEGDQPFWARNPHERAKQGKPSPVNASYITPNKIKTGSQLGF